MTETQNTRICLECNAPLTGRADQLFCKKACKNTFLYKLKKSENSADSLTAENSADKSAGNGIAAENSADSGLIANHSADSLVASSAANSAANPQSKGAKKPKKTSIGGKTPPIDELVKRGKLVKTVAYAAAVFKHEFKLQLRHNEFFEFYEIFDTDRNRWRALSDSDLLAIRNQTGQIYLDEYSSTMTHDACNLIGDENPYDPLKEALASLTWDGVKRIDKWVMTYLGAEDDPLTAQKGRRFLISAVSRAMVDIASAGSKVDTAFVLVGGQGTLKSTVFRVLAEALVPGSYLDDFYFGMNAKETLEQTGGKFIVEDAEIREVGNRGRGHVKQSLSKQSDKARMAYGRIATEKPRRFVTVGSSNEDDFLEDATGSRRFWIVRVGAIDLEGLRRDVAQLWAEAKMLWKSGEKWWLDVAEEVTNDVQNLDFMSDDPWVNLLFPKLGKESAGFMSTEGVLKLVGLPLVDCDLRTNQRVARVMKQLHFDRRRVMIDGRQARGYVRGDYKTALELNGYKELIDTSNLIVMERGKTVLKRDENIL